MSRALRGGWGGCGVLAAALLLGAMGTGCAAVRPSPGAEVLPAARMVRTELYMGMARQGQADVGEGEWAEFLEQVVTPRFPQGITVLSGRGQWLQEGVVVKEPSKTLVVFREQGDASERLIEDIRTEYQRRFNQDAVLRVDDEVLVRFR